MAVDMSVENEVFLKQVVSFGRFNSQEEALAAAIRLLREHATYKAVNEGDILPPEKWIELFDRITVSRKGGNPSMDDSRESVYGDRGR